MALGYNWTNIASRVVYRGAATITFNIEVKLNRQDTTGNYSVVDTRLTSTIVNSLSGSGYNFTLTGANGISGSAVWYFGNETILTGQTTIYHNDDGTKTGNASAYCYNGYWSISESFSGSFELPTIARASIPSISPSSTFNIGDTITIKTNRKSSLFTHTMSLTLGSYTYQLGTNITDSVTLDTSTIANNLYQQITTAPQGTGTITCITYNGTTQIGTKTSSFTAKVTNSNPTFSASYQDTNSTTTTITNNNQQIIRNNSTLRISVSNASAKNYATLSSLSAIIEGTTYTGSLSGTSGTINIGTLNFSSNVVAQVILTDSRGISTTTNVTITMLDWDLPTAIISLGRQNNFYSATDIKVDADYSSLDNKNTITIKVRTKKTTASTYGSYTTLSDNVTSTLTLDNNYAWDVQVLVQDKIGSTTYNLSIGRGIPIVFFDRIKRSMGIDCFPNDDTSLEINGINVLNKIKDTFSTSETLTNMVWIDNKPIYRKVIDIGTLPSNTTKSVSANISNLGYVTKLYGIASSGTFYITLPDTYPNGALYDVRITYDNTTGKVNVMSAFDRSAYSGYVIMEYTKTTS